MDIRCAHCNEPVEERITNFIMPSGDLWRIPVRICMNEQCLRRQGATVRRAEKREHPELKDAPSLTASDWAIPRSLSLE